MFPLLLLVDSNICCVAVVVSSAAVYIILGITKNMSIANSFSETRRMSGWSTDVITQVHNKGISKPQERDMRFFTNNLLSTRGNSLEQQQRQAMARNAVVGTQQSLSTETDVTWSHSDALVNKMDAKEQVRRCIFMLLCFVTFHHRVLQSARFSKIVSGILQESGRNLQESCFIR